ncbi:uncharacterized protein LOC110855533 [Folsomia candida]|uniref:uncharacterized protein LOC110855533 n=1 Tax=Folsomia candida TaxID=158441 RepID=UPI000B8EF79E|nr:uncharacterized protein LOC110855533 [Folsomia candida]
MDRLKKQRTPIRAMMTRTVNELDEEMTKDDKDKDVLIVKLKKLIELTDTVVDLDKQVLDAILDNENLTEEDYLEESRSIEGYNDKCRFVRHKVEKFLGPERSASQTNSSYSTASGGLLKKNYKLPKIELMKFDGEIKNWLEWWAQFKKIDEDEDLHVTDKFHYLVQSMVSGSKAADLIRSYPKTDANYPKAIGALKERYGKDDILVDLYTRELAQFLFEKEKLSLEKFYDRLQTQLQALESLGQEDGAKVNPPKSRLDYLMQFLRQEVEREAKLKMFIGGDSSGKSKKEKYENHGKKKDSIPTAAGLFVAQSSNCVFCSKSNHPSTECYRADRMSWSEKSDLIRSKNLCYRCLKFGHRKSDCKVKLKCSSCGEPHARSMCARLPSNQRNNTGREEVHSELPVTAANANHSCSKDVLMKTLLVKIAGPKGTRIVRLLFDEGSQQSSGGQRTISAIGSPLVGEEWTRNVLFGGILTEPRKIKKFKVQVQSLDGRFKRDIIFRESPTICGDIQRIPAGPWMNELEKRKIFLSDFEMSHVDHPDIELLIGSDYWGQFVCGKPLMLSCGLVAVETVFGWTLSGPVPGKEVSMGVMSIHHSLFNAEAYVQDLWKLKTLGINDPTEHRTKNEKEEEARKHFLRTVSRTQEGRHAVALPWVDEERTIPDNKVVAEKRLISTTTKLRESGNYELYDKVFQDWEKEGLIEEVVGGVDRPCHYLPHRPVYKLESKTTPVRPVYVPKIGVISDIRKAFQMIEVAKPDQDFQRFLWWDNKENPRMKIYRHKRVVFGVKCSPFLLGAVIEYHLSQVTGEEKEYAIKLLRSLYVDNCVTSVDTEEEYEKFKSLAVKMMCDARMELRQWERSSSGAAGISFEQFDKDENSQETTVVLGLNWDKKKDELSVSVPKEEQIENISKRVMLSKVQQFFDPMGYLSPTTIIPKLLLQKTWTEKNSWDEELDSPIKKEFEDWWNQAQLLKEMKIPRWAFCLSYESNRQFHVFCDASQHAYAAAVFVRVEDNEQVSVQLLQAKARVAPMKKVTIPRLELLGYTIAARLSKSVKEALSAETPTFYWSDSTTALAWIKRNDEWGTFVGNRVKEICSLSNSMEWNHVPGVLNPADLPSRGCSPSHLINSKWWEGPDWLKKPKSEWPSSKAEADDEEVRAEMKKVSKVSLIATLPSTP